MASNPMESPGFHYVYKSIPIGNLSWTSRNAWKYTDLGTIESVFGRNDISFVITAAWGWNFTISYLESGHVYAMAIASDTIATGATLGIKGFY